MTTLYQQSELFADMPIEKPLYKSINYYGVELIKEKSKRLEFGNVTSVRSTDDVAKAVENIFGLSAKPQEHLVMLAFDTKNNIIGAFTVHIGTVNSSIVHPRDLLQRALLCNATSFAIAHNHPSGHVTPSPEDLQVTDRIAKAAHIVGIELLDHVITGDNGRYQSLRETHKHLFS